MCGLGGKWVVQSIKFVTCSFSSGPDLMGHEWDRILAQRGVWLKILSLSLPLPNSHMYALSLSKIKKSF